MQSHKRISSEDARRKYGLRVIGVLAVLIVIMFIISMNTGYIRLTPLELLDTLVGKGTEKQELILFQFRLPRIVISLLIGTALAVSGAVMQGSSAMIWPIRVFSALMPGRD